MTTPSLFVSLGTLVRPMDGKERINVYSRQMQAYYGTMELCSALVFTTHTRYSVLNTTTYRKCWPAVLLESVHPFRNLVFTIIERTKRRKSAPQACASHFLPPDNKVAVNTPLPTTLLYTHDCRSTGSVVIAATRRGQIRSALVHNAGICCWFSNLSRGDNK